MLGARLKLDDLIGLLDVECLLAREGIQLNT